MARRTASWRRGAFALAALAVLGAGAACGSSSGGSTPPVRTCGTPGPGWLAYVYATTTSSFTLVVSREDGSCAETLWSGVGDAGRASWSAAAHAIAFTANDGGDATIRVHDFVTGLTSTVVTAPLVPANVALSPDATRLAFEASPAGANPNVFVVPVSGGDPVAIGSSAASDAGPAWSADGQRLYFTSNRHTAWEIWSAPASGLVDPVQVTTGSKVLGVPALSPDGYTMAYARQKPDSTSQVVLHDLYSGDEWIISDQHDGEPAFDATGQKLAVSSSRYVPIPDVVILSARTGGLLQRVTSGTGISGAPAFPR